MAQFTANALGIQRACGPAFRMGSSRRRVTVGATSIATPPDVELKFNKLGASDLLVSEVCMGTMTFGEQNTPEEGMEQLSYAWDCGINFLDTSEVYPIMPREETAGATSRTVGQWMKETRKREEVVIATKVAGCSEGLSYVVAKRTDPPAEGNSGTRVDAANIRAAVEGELRRLQTDYIDLMQIHWPDRYVPTFGRHQYDPNKERESTPFDEQVQAMGDMIKEGKVRHWGLSNETSYGTTMMCLAADRLGVPRPVTIQNSYSLLDRNFEGNLAEVCAASNFNIGLLPWSAGAGGMLSGKYQGGNRPEGARMSTFGMDRYPRFFSDRVNNAIDGYCKVAEEAGVTPMQLAYLFCKSKWFVPSTIIGATKMDQLKENIEGFGKELSEDVLQAIDEVHLQYTNPQNVD